MFFFIQTKLASHVEPNKKILYHAAVVQTNCDHWKKKVGQPNRDIFVIYVGQKK